MASTSLCFSIIILIALFLSVIARNVNSHLQEKCVYTIYVKTGSILKSGTDAKISVTVSDASGRSVRISDLEKWGMMEKGHDYFEWDTVDVFNGRGACLQAPVCRLNLTSDGSGAHHGWFCNYLEVTLTGPHRPCSQTAFYVDQWLATDVPPYQLTAVLDGCGDWIRGHGPSRHMDCRKLRVSNSNKGFAASSGRNAI